MFNRIGDDWVADFRSISNGKEFGKVEIGSLGESREAPEGMWPFIRTYTADGGAIATAGCALPRRIDPALPYVQLHDNRLLDGGDSEFFAPDHGPDWIIHVAKWLSWLVAVMGLALICPFIWADVYRRGVRPWHILSGVSILITLVGALVFLNSASDKAVALGASFYVVVTIAYWFGDKPANNGSSRTVGP